MAEAKDEQIDITSYLEQGFDALQCEEIRVGKAEKVNLSLYARKEFDSMQMK